VAFVKTQGHFVEYAKDLARAKISGSDIATVTDCDCAGIGIADVLYSVVCCSYRPS
jgi:hypothetical protein